MQKIMKGDRLVNNHYAQRRMAYTSANKKNSAASKRVSLSEKAMSGLDDNLITEAQKEITSLHSEFVSRVEDELKKFMASCGNGEEGAPN